MTQLPATLQPTSQKPPDVDVPTEPKAEPVITEAEAVAHMKSQGLVELPGNCVSSLAALGIYVKETGALKIQRGRVLVLQQRADRVLVLLMSEMEKLAVDGGNKKRLAQMESVARTIGQLMGRMTESQRLSIEIEGLVTPSGVPVEDATAPNPSFSPRSIVKPNTTIYADKVLVSGH